MSGTVLGVTNTKIDRTWLWLLGTSIMGDK
jgi:hypothetical protein